jgi:hypothetical protein
MDHSLETDIAAGASAGGFLAWRGRHALPRGAACYNCATTLQGAWCHHCGQLGEDFHRSAHHLIWEALESFFHADGRLMNTLPRLFFEPASLTRDYLAGKRAPQVPPLRLFLVVVLIVFLAGELAAFAGQVHFLHIPPMGPEVLSAVAKIQLHIYKPWDATLSEWVQAHLGRALAHPDQFVAAMGGWAHDFAFLALPVSALILTLLFMFRRGFVVFDHLVFSMHSLSFLGMLFVTFLALHAWVGDEASWLLLAAPAHLFFHMRGVYRTGKLDTLLRMGVLFVCSTVCSGLLVLGLVVLGLAALQA